VVVAAMAKFSPVRIWAHPVMPNMAAMHTKNDFMMVILLLPATWLSGRDAAEREGLPFDAGKYPKPVIWIRTFINQFFGTSPFKPKS
jgi:hypothetical protein